MENFSKITIVVPVFNEEEVIDEFYSRIKKVVEQLPYEFALLFVDDGSTDNTISSIKRLISFDARVTLISLSRNFGKEIALSAGIDFCVGDAAIFIDVDLQDPPEVIPELIEKWEEGFDVVYAQRLSRQGETWFKKASAYIFYRLMSRVGEKVAIPADTGDFRLINRKGLDSLKKMREYHRFMKGLFSWIGFRQIAVPYHRDPRFSGVTKWNYRKLWNLSLEGITSFTIAPLKIATYIGLSISFFAFLFTLFILYKTLVYGDPVAGYPSLMTVVLFLGGAQMFTLGVMGEYIGRMFNETKARPLYLVSEIYSGGQEGIAEKSQSCLS